MSEFPKIQLIDTSTPQGLAMDRLQKSMYFHERERLGLSVDLFVPVCEFCEKRANQKPLDALGRG